jgi:hypothetical protein
MRGSLPMSQSPSPRVYARRQPEKDPLHQVLSAHLLKEVVPGGQGATPKADPEQPPDEERPLLDPEPEVPRARRLLWAQLLQRTFGLDALECPHCGGRMKLVAVIFDPIEIARLCDNLGEPTQAPPVQLSRFKEQISLEFVDPPADFANPP